MMAELLDMEVVNVPTMDYSQAAATAIRMGSRVAGRTGVLVPASMDREKLAVVKNYCMPDLQIEEVKCDDKTGCIDVADLKAKLNDSIGVVYFENPNYFGGLEISAREIANAAHDAGAQCVVGVDPISLGVVAVPHSYGADIVCGDLQPLGIHMNYGGGQSGFMATMDDPTYVLEFPSRLFGICRTNTEGEYAFADVAYDRTSFGHLRDKAKEYVGTQTALWGITAGVYLATMGPRVCRRSARPSCRTPSMPRVSSRPCPTSPCVSPLRSSRSSFWTSTRPARPSRRSTRRCLKSTSSAARISPVTSPRSASAPCTA